MSFICIPPGSAVIYRVIVYVITYLMAGLAIRKQEARNAGGTRGASVMSTPHVLRSAKTRSKRAGTRAAR